MEKICKRCGVQKTFSDFYKNPKVNDGRDSSCKECRKAKVRDNRRNRIDYYREYDRARGNRQPKGYCSEWRASNPIKYAAHTLVGNKLRSGEMVKADMCESCGGNARSLHGHHDDYAKPLEVRWLCPACHKQWHEKYGEGKNAD